MTDMAMIIGNETDLLRAQIESLEKIFNAPSPTVRIETHGGGLPKNGQDFLFEGWVAVKRDEIMCVLNRLRGALTTREELGWS